MSFADRFAGLPTAAKLLLILTAVLLPIGIALTSGSAKRDRQANAALQGRTEDQARAAARSIESLIARNALALRVAANGALARRGGDACDRARARSPSHRPIVSSFELETPTGKPLCTTGGIGETGALPARRARRHPRADLPGSDAIAIRAGVIGGMATAAVAGRRSCAQPRLRCRRQFQSLILHDGDRELRVVAPDSGADPALATSANGRSATAACVARIGVATQRITTGRPAAAAAARADVGGGGADHLAARQPAADPAAESGWNARYSLSPGEAPIELPRKLGPSTEIQELRDAFARAIARVEDSEAEMTAALEGQRRLVREVHHRVKNNLQVVASLLNIHGRSADTAEARAAYAGDRPSRRSAFHRPSQPFRGNGGEPRNRAPAADRGACCRAPRRRPEASRGLPSTWNSTRSTRPRTWRSRSLS